jgi:hypothetical protein
MSWVATGVAIAAAVASAGISYYNTSQEESKQNDIETQDIEQQEALNKKTATAANSMLNKDQQTENIQPAQSSLKQQYLQAVAANDNNAAGASGQVGNLSQQYKTDQQNAELGVSNYTGQQAGDLATMGAIQNQRNSWNQNLTNFGATVGQNDLASQGDAAVANIKSQGVSANPWLQALSSGLSAYASSSGSAASLAAGMGGGAMAQGPQYANGGTGGLGNNALQVNLPTYGTGGNQ